MTVPARRERTFYPIPLIATQDVKEDNLFMHEEENPEFEKWWQQRLTSISHRRAQLYGEAQSPETSSDMLNPDSGGEPYPRASWA